MYVHPPSDLHFIPVFMVHRDSGVMEPHWCNYKLIGLIPYLAMSNQLSNLATREEDEGGGGKR